MQKLNEIQRYERVKSDVGLIFLHPEGQAAGARLVKMRINTPDSVRLFTKRLDKVDSDTGEIVEGEEHFLAYVGPGYEQLEFYYKGDFTLCVDGGEIWLDTLDSSDFTLEPLDHENYARMWEREEVDPRILELQQIARANQRALEQQMAADRAEHQARMAEIRQMMERTNVPAPAPDGNRGTPSPEPKVPASPSGDDKGKPAPAPAGTGGQSDASA